MIDEEDFYRLEDFIRRGNVDAAQQTQFFDRLRAQPALATQADSFGTTLLMIAADAANVAAALHLCDLGADANALSGCGETPLYCTIDNADDGCPSSHSTIARCGLIDALIAHGADPNRTAWQGCSALHWAIIQAHVAFVERLLLGGADANVRIDDRPLSDVNAYELIQSGRFRGTPQQRKAIAALLESWRKARLS